jgi:beta-glucosidase-like glycosyl hydrolase
MNDTTELSLREQLAQLMMIRIGSNLPPAKSVDDDAARVAALLAAEPLGGLLLFHGRFPSSVDVLNHLQASARRPLLIGSDLERGCGQQMAGLAMLPHAMIVDQVADGEQSARRFGQLTGQQARACGIHLVFAPVADVHTNAQNPIIATRALSRQPDRAARFVQAFVEGVQQSGAAATIKHFPGHGDTQQDSHDSLPTVPHSAERLEQVELLPFAAGVTAGAKLVMTAHVAYPSFDSSGAPASLSAPIIEGVLRQRLKFDGVVCSDSLLMAGVKERFAGEGELCLAALLAGIDLLLDVDQPTLVLDYLEQAVESGRLSRQRIATALARVDSLRAWIASQGSWTGSAERAAEIDTEAIQFGRDLAASGIEQRQTGTAAWRCDRPTLAVMLRPFRTPLDPAEQPLANALRERLTDVEYRELGPEATASDYDELQRLAAEAQQVVVAAVVKPAAWQTFGLLDHQRRFVEWVSNQHACCAGIALGVPEALDGFDFSAGLWCTFSDVAVCQQAAAERLATLGSSR